MTRSYLLLGLSTFGLACGGLEPSDLEGPPASGSPTEPPTASGPQTLVIPVTPRADVPMMQHVEPGASGALVGTAHLRVAWGAGYPTELRWGRSGQVYGRCGPPTGVRFSSVQGGNRQLQAEVFEGGDAVELRASQPGQTELEVSGVLLPGEAAGPCDGVDLRRETPFRIQVTVDVLPISGVRFQVPEGTGPVTLAVNSRPNIYPWVLDEDGERFHPANVEPSGSPVTLEVGGYAEPLPEGLTRLGDWQAPSTPHQLTLSAAGSTLPVRVVGPESIVRGELRHIMYLSDYDALTLEEGGSYGAPELGRAYGRIETLFENLSTADASLRTPAPPDWLQLETLTPQVCETNAPRYSRSLEFGPWSVGLLADGRCALEYRAPKMTSLRSLTERFSVEVLDVDGLIVF